MSSAPHSSAEVVRAKNVAEEIPALLRLAAPIALTQAGLALMGVIDVAVVGRYSAAQLGAIGLGNCIFFGIAVAAIGLMMGFDPLIAQAVGANDTSRARKLLFQAAWMALFATLALALPIALAALLLGLPALGIDPEVARVAEGFIWIRLPGLLPMLLYTGTRSYLESLGKVRALLVSTVLANLCNFALDLLLVFGHGPIPPLGALGAGIATDCCALLQFLVLAWAADPKRVGFTGSVSRGLDRAEMKLALRVGVPLGLQVGAEVGAFALAGIIAGHLGTLPLAAHQLALSLASFTFCFALGIGGAGSVRVGWAVGARDEKAMRRSGFVALGAGACVMAVSAITFLLFPEAVARLISDRPEVIAAAVPLLGVAALFQIADGVQAVGAGALRGAGDTRFPFYANVGSHYLIGLPIALVCGFALHRGILGIWWGLSCGLFSIALSLALRFAYVSRRSVAPLQSGGGSGIAESDRVQGSA